LGIKSKEIVRFKFNLCNLILLKKIKENKWEKKIKQRKETKGKLVLFTWKLSKWMIKNEIKIDECNTWDDKKWNQDRWMQYVRCKDPRMKSKIEWRWT